MGSSPLLPQPSSNPVLNEIMGLSPQAKTALGMAGHTMPGDGPPQIPAAPAPHVLVQGSPQAKVAEQARYQQSLAPPDVAPIHMPDAGVPKLGAPMIPTVTPPQGGTIAGDTINRQQLLQGGPPVDSIYHNITNSNFGQNHPFLGKLLGVAGEVGGKIGDTAANAVPGIGQEIPGTTPNHNLLLARSNSALAGDYGNAKNEAGLEDTESQTGLRKAQTDLAEQKPDIEQTKVDQKDTAAQGKLDAAYTKLGYKKGTDGEYAPDENSPQYKETQAITQLHGAQSELATANADYKNAMQNNMPEQMKLAEERIRVAQQKASTAASSLGISRERLNFQEDKQYNPEPTGTERKTGDLAQSAVNQIHTMRGILKAHPEFQSPGGEATQAFTRWLSSNGEDAGKFLAARDYLADHSMAVFGGRSQYIAQQLQGLTSGNFSPSTLHGVLDQAEDTAQHFVKSGTTHGKGETGNAASQNAQPQSSGMAVSLTAARQLPQNKGKSDAEITADIKAHGHEVGQ